MWEELERLERKNLLSGIVFLTHQFTKRSMYWMKCEELFPENK